MKLEINTERGETFALKLYRGGDATITVHQAGDWRTCFLSVAEVNKLRTFLASEPECAPFVAEPQVSVPDTHIMSWETAPMVPTVRGPSDDHRR